MFYALLYMLGVGPRHIGSYPLSHLTPSPHHPTSHGHCSLVPELAGTRSRLWFWGTNIDCSTPAPHPHINFLHLWHSSHLHLVALLAKHKPQAHPIAHPHIPLSTCDPGLPASCKTARTRSKTRAIPFCLEVF